MGSALYQETHDFNYKVLLGKRRKSTECKIVELDEIEDKQRSRKGVSESPSMSKLIMSGSLAHKFLEVLKQPDALVSDLLRLNTKQISAKASASQKRERFVDWRALHKPIRLSEDSKEHVDMAKGKEIKRSKDETRGICTQYINYFTKSNADQELRRSILEEFQKETFWQRVGFKKVNKELPLYSLANDSLRSTRTNIQKTL